mmetsp:Transcript_16377/g.19557  ORF Transcript_16377/g.19557 Transcript_16377/m.19557 type:complete len:305 (+) Transcript_16377:390-1304(+)
MKRLQDTRIRITLQHCQNCDQHSWCTRHKVIYGCKYPRCAQKYDNYKEWSRHSETHGDNTVEGPRIYTKYDLFAEKLRTLLFEKKLNFDLVCSSKGKAAAIGSFEISAVHESGRRCKYSFSKIKSGRWPNLKGVVNKLVDTLQQEHIALLERSFSENNQCDLLAISAAFNRAAEESFGQHHELLTETSKVKREKLLSLCEESRLVSASKLLSSRDAPDMLSWEDVLLLLYEGSTVTHNSVSDIRMNPDVKPNVQANLPLSDNTKTIGNATSKTVEFSSTSTNETINDDFKSTHQETKTETQSFS